MLSRDSKTPTPRRIGPAGNVRAFLWRLPHLGSESASRHRRKVTIAGLFSSGRPSAILWRIRAVVVDAIKRVLLRWSATNVYEKRLVGLSPPIAHHNSAPAIPCEAAVTGVVASGLHSLPNLILGRGLAERALAMSLIRACLTVLRFGTATRLNATTAKVSGLSEARSAAVATAQPLRSNLTHNGQFVETLARYVNEPHIMSLTRVSHAQ